MSSLLESYEQQYGNLTSEITHKLGKLQKLPRGEDVKERQALETLFRETRDLLEQMRLEVSELPSHQRDKYQNRLKSYEKELEKLDMEYKKPRYSDDRYNRDELLGNGSGGSYGGQDDQRVRLLNNTARLERSSHKLDESYRIAIDSEQIASQVLQDLSTQREVLERNRDRLKEVNDDLGKSSRILSSMLMRIIQNRIVLLVVVGVIVIAVVVTIVLVTRRHV